MTSQSALGLIDELLRGWPSFDDHEAHYRSTVIPELMRGDSKFPPERRIAAALRELLTPAEWDLLPDLIDQRRAGTLQGIASDLEREAAAREEASRREAIAQEEERRRVAIEVAEERQREHAARVEVERVAAEETAERDRERRAAELVQRLDTWFEQDFMSAAQRFSAEAGADVVGSRRFEELRGEYVQGWAERVLGEQFQLDDEQAAAVAAIDGDVQVVARAGSGKTRTLTARAAFLQRHCSCSPRSILCLAFNRAAAEEMKERLNWESGDSPHVMTFHALAHALVHPNEDLKFDDQSAGQHGLSRVVQDVIDEHISSPEDGPKIRGLMLAQFREDWERIEEGGFHLAMDELIAYRRALPRESLRGEYVKSFGEKVIANALFEHDIDYRYEASHRWSGVNYKPDFKIITGPNAGIIIEYFGLTGDRDYDEQAQAKRDFWSQQPGWELLEFAPRDLASAGTGAFVGRLISDLAARGVRPNRLDEDEIWTRIRKRAVDRFSRAVTNFIGRCRKQDLEPLDLATLVDEHRPASPSEATFLEIAEKIFAGYLERLIALGHDDFDGLMWRAIRKVRSGDTAFVRDRGRERGDLAQLDFLLIDELQDFSKMFFELVKAIEMHNPAVRLFCVGDDWQAINGFAGSDLKYFESFQSAFPRSQRLHVRTNYRSASSIVEIGNALMVGQGEAGRPHGDAYGAVRVAPLDEFKPSAAEQDRHNDDELTPAVLRLVTDCLSRDMSVVMLSRRNRLPWFLPKSVRNAPAGALSGFLEHVRSFLPEDDRKRVTISTTHRYKGMEEDAVVVLDAVDRSYPLVHPSWVFQRVFGDTIAGIEREERRLFYVALTRARMELTLLTDGFESPYLQDLRASRALTRLAWSALPPAPSLDGARVEIRVHDAYAVKDQLIARKYIYMREGKYWVKVVLAEAFTVERLVDQPWTNSTVRIEIRSETGEVLHQINGTRR